MASQVTTNSLRQAALLSPAWQSLLQKRKSTAFSMQKEAIGFLETHGLPSRRTEDWRYSGLTALMTEAFVPKNFDPEKSIIGLQKIPKGISLTALSAQTQPELFQQTLLQWRQAFQDNQRKKRRVLAATTPLDAYRDGSEALHESFVESLVLIEATQNVSDLVLQFQSKNEQQGNQIVFPRILVHVKSGASLSLTTDMKMSEKMIHSKFQVIVEEGAHLSWVHVQNHSVNSLNIEQVDIIAREKSRGHYFSFAAGSQQSRQNLRVTLPQEYAEFKVHGTVLGRQDQQFDSSTVIEHLKGKNFTEQIYKSILDDRAKSVFGGLVYIDKDAQEAKSEQLNKSLLLSTTAEVISKPQLEIYADDVKATHGSTVGQLLAEEVFYLKSRAISEAKAMVMLSHGFAADLIYTLENQVQRNLLLRLLEEKLKRGQL